MADSVLQLKRDRGAHVAELNRLCQDTEKLLLSRDNKSNVKQQLFDLDKYLELFKAVHAKLMAAVSDAATVSEFESQYNGICSNHAELKVRVDEWFADDGATGSRVGEGATGSSTGDAANVSGSGKGATANGVGKGATGSEDAEGATGSGIGERVTGNGADGSASEHSDASTRAMLRRAQQKRQLAELKLKQLAQRQELERSRVELELKEQTLKLRGELEEAQLEEDMMKEEEEDESQERGHIDRCNSDNQTAAPPGGGNRDLPKLSTEAVVKSTTTRQIEDAVAAAENGASSANYIQPRPQQENNMDLATAMDTFFRKFKASNDLPKPELLRFNGNPADYSKFIHNFESSIESNVSDDKLRLNYLIQFCDNEAKACIEPFVLLEPGVGYVKAKSALRDRFGMPHIIARAHIDKLANGPELRNGDVKGLEQLAADMSTCEITLNSMGFSSDINSSDNLRKIVKRLPYSLRGKWVDKAYVVLETTGEEPKFSDLSKFIAYRVKASSTMYGFDFAGESKKSNKNNYGKPGSSNYKDSNRDKSKVTSLLTQGDRDKSSDGWKCWCCDGSCASLSECQKFIAMNIDDRKRTVRKLRLCDNCFRYKHIAKDCRKPKACTVPECSHKHNTLLHSWSTTTTRGSLRAAESNVNCSITSVCGERKVCMSIVPVRINGANGSYVNTYALLDNGSDVTLCDERLLKRLHIKGKPRSFSITTVNQQNMSREGTEVYLNVKPLNGGESIKLPKVWTVSELPVSLKGLPGQKELSAWPHLSGIDLPKIPEGEVMLLIGSDVPEVLCPIEVRRGSPGEPCAMLTPLGWTIIGPICQGEYNSVNVNFQQKSDNGIHEQLERLWTTDFSDKLHNTSVAMSVEDKRALHQMQSSTMVEEDHFRMALPWRDKNVQLPYNRSLAFARLKMLKSKLTKDADLHGKYTSTINDYISNGFARKLSDRETREGGDRVWYLPHHPVTNDNKPGKVRVVYDCAARYGGTSLNEKLLQGPDLVNNLVGVLMRFRQEPVAIAADVESMFHQVRVDPRDHNSLRFLWWPDGDLSKVPQDYCMQVHLFGATSSPSCSAYALRRTAEDQSTSYDENVISTVLRNFYVDDCLKSCSTEIEAIKLATDLRSILINRGFRLTKWLSNSREVLESIPESERAPSVKSIDLDTLPCDRALGVQWNVETDCLQFKVKLKEKPDTRRGILSVTSSLFDPLGLVAPVTLSAKLILQTLCRLNLGWDDDIPGELQVEWRRWLQELPQLNHVHIDRCIKPNQAQGHTKADVHIFSDASEVGYGACAYLRLQIEENDASCALIIGKSRLAPIKKVSIPRLELSAAVVACRLHDMIKSEIEIPIDSFTFWTDSTIVLGYIRNNTTRFKTFVANRLSVIQETTNVTQWRYVPGPVNPADLASRGISAKDGEKLEIWINGPKFLHKEPGEWPVGNAATYVIPEEDVEIKRQVCVNVIEVNQGLDDLMSKYSSLVRLKRAVAWLLRFKTYCKSRYLKNDVTVPTNELSVNELKQAEAQILKIAQSRVYAKELIKLHSGNLVCLDSPLAKLCPIIEDDLVKVGGRLQRSTLQHDSKHPIILPEKHPVTRLIIKECHETNGHVGVHQVLAATREKFWIVRGVGAVKRVLGDCYNCKRRTAVPCRQQMAPLPEERLTPDKPPFSFVGIDYFGPVLVKVGRAQGKRYGCLFTCLTTRAVHIEIAHSLTTDSFLAAFLRFCSRRGRPEKVFSDNGTNLVGGEKELRESLAGLNQAKITREMSQREIQWTFLPPQASHMGGVYERMIRTTRRVLKALAGEQLLNDESLLTLVAECEKILNDRPITQVSNDPSDPQALSPNMLLLLRPNSCMPPGAFNKDDSYLNRRWRQVQYLSNIFWRRWLRVYLPSLQIREKWQRPHRDVRVNDIVVIVDESVPRGQWPLGVVKQVNVSRDGYVRSCVVRRGGSEIVRPICKLCLLEMSS